MNMQTFDSVFPIIVFSYGILIVFVLENKRLAFLGKAKMPSFYAQLTAHRSFAWLSFWVGGLWTLQLLIFS